VDLVRQIYVLTVKGGSPFAFQALGNPTIEHDPSKAYVSVHTVTLSRLDMDDLVLHTLRYGCEIEARCLDEATEEQQREQMLLLGLMGQEGRVWPTAKCPECFWFDPLNDEPCGGKGWPMDMRREAYRSHPTARQDLDACPLISAN
jgi:hypothetical protein